MISSRLFTPGIFTPVLARKRGFTLIELLITVAIVGLLAAVSIPAYKSFVAKGNRGAVQSHMLSWATAQSQYLADARTYGDKAQLEKMVPTPDTVSSKYTLTVETAATPPTFMITAKPISGGTQEGEPDLTISHTGARTPASKW